jgi:hypothetical protein
MMHGSDHPELTTPPTLDVAQQKDVYKKLQHHFNVIFNAPCKPFPGYPFTQNGWKHAVSFTAIIEHFEDDQQRALISSYNKTLKKGSFCSSVVTGTASIVGSLQAKKLNRVEGGIQFEASPGSCTAWPPERVMQELKTYNVF